MATYYFSETDGNDSNTSTQAQNPATPWKTLSKLNSFFSSLSAGDSCLLKRGDTFYGTIVVNKSGSAGNVITIGAYSSGAKPIVSGGTLLTSWSSLGGGIYQSTLSANPEIVTIGDTQYVPGRFPNTGWLNIDSTTSGVTGSITSSGLTGLPSLIGDQVVIRQNRFAMQTLDITGNTGTTIEYTTVAYDATVNWGFFVQKNAAFLDDYGDWMWDSGTNKLKVYFGGGGTSDAVATNSNVPVTISSFDYITLSNIDIRHSNTYLIQLDTAAHITIDSCDIHFGLYGIRTSTTNDSLTITNNAFSYTNSDSIKMYGSNDGTLIDGNTFDNIGMIPGGGGTFGGNEYRAIAFETEEAAQNTIVRYNTITNIGYVGISGGGTNSLIKNNILSTYCYLMDDGGGIYIQCPTTSGKRITGNLCLGGATDAAAGTDNPSGGTQIMGIYSDGSNQDTEIDNNTCHANDNGVYMDNSSGINIHDNNTYANRNNEIAIDQTTTNVVISSLTIENNIFTSAGDQSDYPRCAAYQNQCSGCGNVVADWGAIDNNVYARPILDTTTIRADPTGSGAADYTLSGWVILMSGVYDSSSTKSPFSVADASLIKFSYNATASSAVVSLPGTYEDMLGNIYVGSVTLAAYSSITLLFLNNNNPGGIIALL